MKCLVNARVGHERRAVAAAISCGRAHRRTEVVVSLLCCVMSTEEHELVFGSGLCVCF